MKKLLVFCFVTGIIASCNNSINEEKITNVNYTKDSLGVLFKDTLLPFVLDTNTLYKLETFDSLGSNIIRLLAKEIDTSKLTRDYLYTLNSFYTIDSIKIAGKYLQYCDSLDIGMIKNATAHALYKINLDSNTVAYLWGIHYESYEACPITTANIAFISVIHKHKITETFCVGNNFWFADPPSMASEWTYSKIDTNRDFSIDITRIVDDIDDSLPEEISKTHYRKYGFKPY